MISYITSFFNYLFPKNNDDEDDDKENFLAEQLLDIEIGQQSNSYDEIKAYNEIPRNTDCFKRTGVITYMNETTILIDGVLYFDPLSCNLDLKINDKVLYLGYKNANDTVVVARILENQGTHWGGKECLDNVEENKFKVVEHVIIGEVDYRKDRFVYMKEEGLKFNLDDIKATFVPIQGDWLELNCKVQWDEEKPSDISAAQVLKVVSIRPLRSKIKSAVITECLGDEGVCDKTIYFNKQCLEVGFELRVGCKVILEAIESNQGKCMWRAIKLCLITSNEFKELVHCSPSLDDEWLQIEEEYNVDITNPLKFESIDVNETATIDLNITNNSDQIYRINKWVILNNKRSSQISIDPCLVKPIKLYPKQKMVFSIKCQPKFLGFTKEHLIIMFKGFKVNRIVEINVVNSIPFNTPVFENHVSNDDKVRRMRELRKSNNTFIPGVKHSKPPAFIPVKLAAYQIPDKIWSTVLGDSEMTVYSSEYEKILYRIANNYPCLSKSLNITNYVDRWHTLLYMEEVQCNINMRVFDMQNVYLVRCNEYLAIEFNKLAERRPSIIKNDRVIVKDSWNNYKQQYEGFVHMVKGNLVLMKFHQQFHESYSGYDLSITFHSCRSSYRRCHQAVNIAISHLGEDILFPCRVLTRSHQVPTETIETITWYNNSLNMEQKSAVIKILQGECRPMPYCIFGPPGTGKTMTVIETILQILTVLPDSRLVIATPSNSAANLITERLLKYRHMFCDSIVRLIANRLLDSDNIPDIIRPFCATLDISLENSRMPRHHVQNGINISCQKSFVGRHRITIGTCHSVGVLSHLGFPRGHFTHVIIDEAGQITEPEILIPLNYIDKESGQIILAGDPMQLGPILMSKYCKDYGMDESYFWRIMQTFPYQRDFDAFKSGFNNKLITRLKDNYRSLQEVLNLPSAMFYDGSLVAKIDQTQSWIQTILTTMSEIFDTSDSATGGIYVYGIRGCNARSEDNPSWYNPQEASMVALTTCKLYKKNISAKDIGIVTPYISQVKYIRVLFEAMGLPLPKIGSVEEFQGQERPIVIISTVRTSKIYLQDDIKHTLGFVKNQKRLNVALTRAQVAVILFCDPHLLSTDPLWKQVIDYAFEKDKYTGCDWPNHMSDS